MKSKKSSKPVKKPVKIVIKQQASNSKVKDLAKSGEFVSEIIVPAKDKTTQRTAHYIIENSEHYNTTSVKPKLFHDRKEAVAYAEKWVGRKSSHQSLMRIFDEDGNNVALLKFGSTQKTFFEWSGNLLNKPDDNSVEE